VRRDVILAFSLVLLCAAAAIGDDIISAPARTVRLDINGVPPGHLPWVVFDERSGLPQNTIVDMVMDQQGFVWAATQDGAARFNGRLWETVPLPRSMGSNYPRVIRAAKDGGLWIGSFDGGLAHLRDGQWNITDMSSGLPSNRIRGLLETSDALWIATDRGVSRLQNGKLTTFGERSGLQSLDTEALCETTMENGERTLLVGTANGLARFAGDHFVSVPVPQQILGNRIGDIVESTGLNGHRALWITSYGAGLGVLEDNAWTILDTASGLPSNVEVLTKSTAADGSPALWIGTEGGLIRFEHGHFTLYDERAGLPIRIIWKVLETTAPGGLKTIWLGTWGGGVVRLSPNGWTAFDASTGIPRGSVTSVLLTNDDKGVETIWAGTSDGELAMFENGRFQPVTLPEPLRHTIIFSLLETKDDDGTRSLWVGSFGGGAGRFKDGRWTVYGPNVLPNLRVYTIAETKAPDGSRVLWIGTEGGLSRFTRGTWTTFRQGAELPSDIVTQVVETTRADGTRTLWVATSNGIACFEFDRWSVIGKKAGLPGENIVSMELTTDADGKRWIWAGTLSGGASRLALDDPSKRWETFDTKTNPPLPSDTIQGITQDHQHRIYLSTTRGVARLTPRTPTPDDSSRFTLDLFTTDDGLPSGDCQQGARLVDQHGRVWVGTARGLAMFDPSLEIPDREPKLLVIQTAHLSNGKRILHGGESLSYAEHNISFEYALLAFSDESRIRYRYQLVGFDPQPSAWTAAGLKEYTNLGAGHYTFQVWGRDARGNTSGPVLLSFQILRAPWLTPWAFGAYLLIALAAAYSGVQWRVRTLSRRTKELEAVVMQRTNALRETNKKLLEAQEQIAKIAESSPQAIDNLSAWIKHAAKDIAQAVDAREVGVWKVDGDTLIPLIEGSLTQPSLDEIKNSTSNILVKGTQVQIPARGISGEMYGVVLVSGSASPHDEIATRLMAGFAHQLGGTLEMLEVRRKLERAEERRIAARQEMKERGISIVQVCDLCKTCYDESATSCEADGKNLEKSYLFPFVIEERYRLVRLLGEGGMGCVFLAQDEKLKRPVSIKIIQSDRLNDPMTKIRLKREADVIARIQHPGVVSIYDFGVLLDGSCYILMEFLKGTDLAELLEDQGPGSPGQVAAVLAQVADALATTHAQGIVHRDLKPANLFVTPSSSGFQIKVLDFGLAKSVTEDVSLTMSGTVVGTPGYMSPEQIRGDLVDEQSDLFSLAAVAFELLTGQRAFEAESAPEVFARILTGDPPILSDLLPAAGADLDQMFYEALARDPEQRPRSVSQWAQKTADMLHKISSSNSGWNLDKIFKTV